MPYRCSNCLRSQILFHLSCPECGAWNSLRNEKDTVSVEDSRPVALADVSPLDLKRVRTNIRQLDLLLGDGFVPGSSVLLTGTPGAGKSTLIMQLLKKIHLPSLYVSGEESIQQLKVRANRMKIRSSRILLLFETDVNKVLSHIRQVRPALLVIDSIQTMYNNLSGTVPGGPAQIRKCSYQLRRAAQQLEFILILVGQVTKGGVAAGPKLLEHAVDVVLSLEVEQAPGQKRTLSSSKNRFGSTGPKCVLSMQRAGLVFQDDDP